MDLKEKILYYTSEFFNEIVQNRRYLHQHPELSFREFGTSGFISKKLTEYGIRHKSKIAETGIVGWIEGRNPEIRMIALRADMDALPIQEENDVSYRSLNSGVMHACGHDVHMASLLGVARVLNQIKDEFEGTVMLIFQPSEERLPGGAKLMMEQGIFDDRKPDIMIAQHVFPSLDAGFVGFKPGVYMASTDELYVTIKGKGGHGAIPHEIIDPVLAASHIIVALQQIVSRNAEAVVPTVLSFGKVIANGSTNIVPNEVYMEGTFRTMNELWRDAAHEKMVKLAKSIAEGMGVECDFVIKKGYPLLINDEDVTRNAEAYAKELLGPDKIKPLDIRMTAEDFSYFSQLYPSTYYRLGVRKAGKMSSHLHSSGFDIDEEALRTGVTVMTWLGVRFLQKTS
jgi:amidohydrolase